MSPVEHYFENLLTLGSDIKGEPNKNKLSKEVQEAVEICATYVKLNINDAYFEYDNNEIEKENKDNEEHHRDK